MDVSLNKITLEACRPIGYSFQGLRVFFLERGIDFNKHDKRKKQGTHWNTNPAISPVLYTCAQSYHLGSSSHGQLFRPCQDSSSWRSRRAAIGFESPVGMPFTAKVDAKHSFKLQLHRTHVVAVGWGQHGCPPTACVWGGGSAFLLIGVSVNLSQRRKQQGTHSNTNPTACRNLLLIKTHQAMPC